MSNKTSFTRTLVILVIVSLVFLSGCGGGASQSFNNQQPTPTITTISPNSTSAGGVAFTLAINGINFVSGSTVYFGGAAPATTFVNSTQLTAAIPAAAIASTGTAAVTVTNPGGRTSNVISFSIISGTNPVPAINFLSPKKSTGAETFEPAKSQIDKAREIHVISQWKCAGDEFTTALVFGDLTGVTNLDCSRIETS